MCMSYLSVHDMIGVYICSGVSRILYRGVLDSVRAKRARKILRPHPSIKESAHAHNGAVIE